MKPLQLIFGLMIAALGLWFASSIFIEPTPPQVARTFESSVSCKDCHQEVYAEWEGSQHSISWTNPAVRALSNEFANQDCIDCHAPRPVFVSGIGERVLPRASRRVEGVDCITCHLLPENPDGTPGGMAGTIANANAACRPVQRVELQRVEFCAGCHDQHETVRQWRASEWPARGEDCLSCHMPYRNGDPNSGRDHTCLGGNSLALLKSAVELRGVRVGEGWKIEVENVGAGHSFPTDERSRAADVFWRPVGNETWQHLYRFRSPYRFEVDIVDNLLLAHETRNIALEEPEAQGAVEVALFYKRSPHYEDPDAPDPEREATLVQRIVLEP